MPLRTLPAAPPKDLQQVIALTLIVIGAGSLTILLFDHSSDLTTTWDTVVVPVNSIIYFASGIMIARNKRLFNKAVMLSALPSMLYQQGVFFEAIQSPSAISYYSAASAGGFFPMLYVVLFVALPRHATKLALGHCLIFYLQYLIHCTWLTSTEAPAARASAEAILIAVLLSHPLYVLSLRYIVQLNQKIQQTRATGLKEKADFLAMLSHELRNILQTLVCTLEVLQLKHRAEPEQTTLKNIDFAIQRLDNCLREASEISRLESAGCSLIHTDLKAADLCQAVDKHWQDTIEPGSFKTEINAHPADLVVHSNKNHLQKIIEHITERATHSGQAKSISVSITATSEHTHLIVTVQFSSLDREATACLRVPSSLQEIEASQSVLPEWLGNLTRLDMLIEQLEGRMKIDHSLIDTIRFDFYFPSSY